jgi:hypothetical protein
MATGIDFPDRRTASPGALVAVQALRHAVDRMRLALRALIPEDDPGRETMEHLVNMLGGLLEGEH